MSNQSVSSDLFLSLHVFCRRVCGAPGLGETEAHLPLALNGKKHERSGRWEPLVAARRSKLLSNHQNGVQ